MKKVDESEEQRAKLRQRKRTILVVAALAIMLFSIYGWWEKTNSVAEIKPVQVAAGLAETSRKAPRELVVYVSGQVKHPGVLTVAAGARVIDAIDAAGGLAEGADVTKVNLAQPVKDGMQIHVHGLVSAPVAAAKVDKNTNRPAARTSRDPSAQAPAAHQLEAERININTAAEAELDKLPGIGPALAARIVEWRRSHGAFHTSEDIKKVPGVGDAKYQLFRDHITW